jgi:hypothetical protein
VIVVKRTKSNLADRFEDFHQANPDFYESLVERTREYLDATGNDKVGIQAVMEQARWDRQMKTKSADFKVNNDFAAFYARLIMLLEADLDGVFQIRKAHEAARWIRVKASLLAAS